MSQQIQHSSPTTTSQQSTSSLAAKVAHELNNPLDAVLRFVSLAQRKAKAGHYTDIERYLADAQFGLQRMTEILRELMDLGRQSNDILGGNGGGAQDKASAVSLPLSDLIARATRTAAAAAEQKHLALIIKSLLPDTLSPVYDIRVAQILSNLLKNAIEAAPENTPVRLTVLAARLAPRFNDSAANEPSERDASVAANLIITIEDQGAGIPPEILPQLFTPFLTSKPEGLGHGLGLAISRELALSLNGDLALRNCLPTGCLATLTLPLVSGQLPVASGQTEKFAATDYDH
jgi:signal transduction histidine kinase